MALLLGVDTGGTFTDAVLLRDEHEVVASAKALTTRQDLAIGVRNAISAVLAAGGAAAAEIGLASLSTTLATNALVEDQGGRVGLVAIGLAKRELERHGLDTALLGDPVLEIAGGHGHSGLEAAPLDTAALARWLQTESGVSAFAVAARFATRNPAHELAAAEMIRAATGRPVSCSHHLSARLNGPKRALTALLNARLVGMIARLIDRTEAMLAELGIRAPLMVVRDDGALISAALARERPIETILSGPAASLVGARWLSGARTALVSDIGGTTTDVAVLRDGRPALDPAGARIGPWRTMVEAVAVRTTGLGGDSEVHVKEEGLAGGVTLGPRRIIPVSLLAMEAADAVHGALDAQLRREVPEEHDGRFVRAVTGIEGRGLAPRDAALLRRVGADVRPVGEVLKSRLEQVALDHLVRRGLVQLAGRTPTDASHVLGWLDAWDMEAAEKALALLARRRGGAGTRFAPDAAGMARVIVDRVTHQTGLALLETAFAEDAGDFGLPPEVLARHVLVGKGLEGHRGLVRLEAGIDVPIVGLGASAPTYYPAVGERLGCEMILPSHAGVANAIGAVVGQVTIRRQGTVTSPTEGTYRVHLESGPEDHRDPEAAVAALEAALERDVRAEAAGAGARDVQVSLARDLRRARAEDREVFLEAVVTAEASGRPRIAG